jgi:hypothetical protein
MTLNSAHRHLRRRHFDCWSCQIEAHMVAAMAQGQGFVVPRQDPFARLFSKALDRYVLRNTFGRKPDRASCFGREVERRRPPI